jgi:hypothetical protein
MKKVMNKMLNPPKALKNYFCKDGVDMLAEHAE